MADLLCRLASMIEMLAPKEGLHPSASGTCDAIKFSRPDPRVKRHWRASLAIVAQGCKEVVLGRRIYRFEGAQYLATPIDLPVTSRIALASTQRPFLALRMDFDPSLFSEVDLHLEEVPEGDAETRSRAIFVGDANERMLDGAIRLARLFGTPGDARVLEPLVKKEMIYYLLSGKDGASIRRFLRAGCRTYRISQAIHGIRSDLGVVTDVDALAKQARMSRSTFFEHFKAMTAMSPIQYQKRLRLLEARRLMIDEGETVERSAYRVGYRSPSQFSREYARMFGDSPMRDAAKVRRASQRNQRTDPDAG